MAFIHSLSMFDPAETAAPGLDDSEETRDLDKMQYLTGENLQFICENTKKGHFTLSLLIIIMVTSLISVAILQFFWLVMDIMVLLLEARLQALVSVRNDCQRF